MKQFLLSVGVLIMIWSSTSVVVAGEYPMPFGENYRSLFVQDVPLYPNPARDHIYVRPAEANFLNDQDLTIEIRNILGNEMPVRLERNGQGTFRVNLSNYPSGYYMLILQCEHCGSSQNSQKAIHKFLKQ